MDYISLQFPEGLKEAEDQRFFLSLFTENNENGFITDKIISNKVCKIGIKQKVFREINKAIYVLSKGEDIPRIGIKANIQLHEKSNARAICMLVGLKCYLNKIKPNLIDALQGKSLSFHAPSSDKEWILSYPLLLVQSVRFSQWEWENQDYCFEYFSAELACAKLEALLDKAFTNGSNKNKEIALKTIRRLIRWQTLHGQYVRCSSTFDVNDNMLVDGQDENEYRLILEKMLEAVSYADHFLKFEKSHNEKIISALLKNGEINRLLIEEAEYNDLDFQWGSKQFKLDKKKPELSGKNDKQKIIFSYFSGCPDKLKDKILKKIPKYPNKKENRFTHIILNRKQSDLGLCKRLKDIPNNLDDLVTGFVWKELENPLSATGLPLERIFLVSYKPNKIFFANELYHLQMNEKKEYGPKKFLAEAIRKCKKKFNVIPLPMIKRITDLLRFFKEVESENDKVFPAYIIFNIGDKIEKTVEVWLPDIEKEIILKDLDYFEKDIIEDIDIDIDIDIVIKILGRYLIYVVSNYGMTHRYKKVDIDFSASKHYIPGYPHPWSIIMRKMNEALGVYVFENYLSLCGSDILEKSYAREDYLAAIDHRRMTDLYQFGNKEKVREAISEKYILGIDVGASGIKFQFFKIDRLTTTPGKQSCYIDDELFLTEDETHAIPTSRPSGKFRDASDFAAYVFDTLKNRLVNKDLFSKTICIGVCWPGPIKQNKVVGTSGALTNFVGIKGLIMEDNQNDILSIDIERAFREKFSENLKNPSKDSMLTVALINDGDAEAAGLLFGKVNKSQDENEKEFYKSLFAEHSVAIIKAGTGTAGAVTVNGRFIGFNEFGKVIVDLGISNERNNTINRKNRWPLGDANKLFSVRFLKEEAIAAGILGAEVEGRDIELLVDVKDKASLEEKKKYFGALELVTLARPNIEYSELEEKIKKQGDDTILNYNVEDGYKLGKEENKDSVHHGENNFQQLLAAFGEYRITRLNLRSVFKDDNMQIIENIGKKMGRRLADVVATLHDIYDLKAVFIAGGPIKGKIGNDCVTEFREEMKKYLYDRFYEDDHLIRNLDKARVEYKGLNQKQKTRKMELQNIFEKHKFFYFHEKGPDNALRGVAIQGFDLFIVENKIRELQQLAKNCSQKTRDSLKFVTNEEIKRFIDVNAGRLKVTYSNGTITSLESKQR